MALSDPMIGDLSILDLLIFVIFIAIIAVTAKVLYYLLRRYLDGRVAKKSSKSISRLIQYIVLLLGLYIGFVILLRQDLSSLFVSLGIIGLAVALAAQQVLQNVFAGMLISISKPYELEDWVEIGGVPATRIARVRDISLMFTELRDVDGKTISLPNSLMLSNKVVNYTKAGFIALEVTLPLKQGTDLAKAYKIVYDVADLDDYILPTLKGDQKTALAKVLERPNIRAIFGDQPNMKMFDPQLNIVKLEESRITLEARIWVKDPQKQDEIISRFLGELNKRFKDEGIELADQ